MHICFDGNIFSLQRFGGISTYIIDLASQLLRYGNEVDIIYNNKPIQPVKLKRLKSKALYFPGERELSFLNVFAECRRKKYWSSLKSDIVHASYYSYPNQVNIPVVVTVYDMIYEKYPEYFVQNQKTTAFIESKRRAVVGADAVICISEATKNDVLDLYDLDEKKVYVTPLAASSFYKNSKSMSSKRKGKYFLYVGSRAKYKRFDWLLEVYSKWNGNQDYQLRVVGAPFSSDEQRLLSYLGLESKVTCGKDSSNKQLRRLYASAAALIISSIDEGFGIPVLEAMSMGCPVVAPDIPVFRETVGDTPTYFERDSESDLLRGLDAVLDKGTVKAKIERGVKAASSYSWERTAKETLEVYRRLVHE